MDLIPRQPPGGWPTPRSAYIHIPFCRHRCGYCNFSVIAGRDDLMDRFVAAIDQELALLNFPTIDTLFLGGGTPTHLPLPLLDRLLGLLSSRFSYSSQLEFSVEANPEDICESKLKVLQENGVNRMSLGVQSFDSGKLKMLQRDHSRGGAIDAIELAAKMIGNVSIDLIFAAPDETLEIWNQDLSLACLLPIDHLSTYALTFEKGTSFWNRRLRGELAGQTEESEVAMYELAQELAAKAGLTHYEISNFAKPDRRCQHNLTYWRGKGWFAAGPGAARFVDGKRDLNHRSPTTYLKRVEAGQDPVVESEVITLVESVRERLAFGIRMIDGIDLQQLHEETEIDPLKLCRVAITQCLAEGLIVQEQSCIRLSKQGILFADLVAGRMLDRDV